MYELRNLLEPERVIGQSGSIATLFKVIDNQQRMTKTGLVIVKNGEIVAGEASLLDRMVASKSYKFDDMVKLVNNL